MKINAILQCQNIFTQSQKCLKKQLLDGGITAPDMTSIFPTSVASTGFKGRTIPKLWEEYNWYTNCDRTPAIQAFLKIKAEPEMMDKFLNEILSHPQKSKDFFSSIVYHPREATKIRERLPQVIPQNSPNVLTFLPNSPYYKAYTEFIDWKVKEAKSLEDLLRIRPDWRGDLLLKKYNELHPDKTLEIGNIPIAKNHLDSIIDYLSTQMEFGIKSKKKIPDLMIDNRNYQFAFFTEGRSDKNVFGLFTPEGKKYVIKMSAPQHRSLDKPFALGTLAKIDSYLTYNRSRNSAPLCYYNHDRNFSIYKYIEHIPVENSTKDLNIISNNMPDFKSLGLTYNDTVGEKNFFKLAQNSTEGLHHTEGFWEGINKGEWITVDNDHVTYANMLQPSLTPYHASLPNAMGMFT